MGFFKKIIRKVTKPVSKVLDKVVPNEIKPFLPYAAAAVPFLAPASFGLGSLNPIVSRALLSGGANLASQLAQEGNEGDVDLLSLAMASGTGALTAPGAGEGLRSLTTTGRAGTTNPMGLDRLMSNRNFLQKAGDFGLTSLAKGADFLSAAKGSGGAADILAPGGTELTMKNALNALAVPVTQATGEAMKFEANAAMKEYERALAEYNEQQGALGTDAGRREAILSAMRAYNHPEELIDETLAELGLRNGGRVAYNMGGRIGFAERGFVGELRDNTEDMIGEIAKVMFRLTPPGMMMFGMDKATELYNDLDEDDKQKVKDYAVDFGLRMASPPLAIGKGIYDYFSEDKETKAMGGRVGLEFGGIPAAVQKVADKQLTSNLETAQDMQIPMEELVQEFIELKGRKPNDYDELLDYYRQKYGKGSQISSMTEEMTEEFAANGGMMGRKPFVSGGFGRGIKSLFGMGDEVVDLAKQKEVFRDGPITADFLQTVDKSIIDPAIRSRDTMGPGGYGMYKNLAEMPAGLQAAELISRIRKPGGGIDYEKAELFIGKKLRGNETIDELIAMIVKPQRVQKAADGGIMEYNMGGSVLPDGIEMDYRGGGFIPMGSKERADDVPARVSKNEFVMTADAVRAAGGGNVNKGAKRMYELMNNLEARA